MSLPDFEVRLTRIAEAAQRKEYGFSLQQTLEAKELLYAQAAPDPIQLGWILHFEFANLYALKEYARAWEAFNARVPFPYGISRKNQAWRLAVAAEVASFQNEPLEVLRLGRRALAMRMHDDDLEGRVHCLINNCVFLRRVEREDLNLEFTRYLLSSGSAHHIHWMTLEGFRHLCWNAEKTANRTVHQVLEHYLGQLANDEKLLAETGAKQIIDRGFDLMLRHQQILEHRRSRKDFTQQLVRAVELQDPVLAEQMLRNGADPDGFEPSPDSEPVFPPLHRAVQLENLEMARLLISFGADIHDQERTGGYSPLAIAVGMKNATLAALLLAQGADPNKKTVPGQTLLMRAVIEQHSQMIALLIDQGAFTEARDDVDNTVLQLAASEGNPRALQLLIDAGADANVKNDQEQGLVHLAAMHGQLENVQVLIAYGMSAAEPDKQGLLPIDWARKGGHQAVVDFLTEHAS